MGEESVLPLPLRAHAQPAPAPFDYRAIAAALRPDLDPDPVWDKFCIYHAGSEFSVKRHITLWRGWLAREMKSQKIASMTDRNKSPKRVLGGFATPQTPADIIVTDYEVHHGT